MASEIFLQTGRLAGRDLVAARQSRPSPKAWRKIPGWRLVLRDEMSGEDEQVEAEHRSLHVGFE